MSHLDPVALLDQLTWEEKIQLSGGADLWRTAAIPRLDIPYIKLTDGPVGARGGGDFTASTPSTLFPSASCVGATWDPQLAFAMGRHIALDAIEKRCHVVLGPTINGQRDPRAGRFFESYAEDPVLTGALGGEWVRGCQSVGVGATMKHYVANEAETDRRFSSSDMSAETLREVYLEPFRLIMAHLRRSGASQFDGQPACVMTAYNRINGVSASENDLTLNRILRQEWGFDGLVMSDWFALHSDALGYTDLEMPGPPAMRRQDAILAQIQQGGEEAQRAKDNLNRCALQVLKLVKAVAPLGYDKRVEDEVERSVPVEQVGPAIRQIGAEGAMLLKNEGDILPLVPRQGLRVACIGAPWLEAVQSGGGSADLTPQKVMEPFATLREALDQHSDVGKQVQLDHHGGVDVHDFVRPLRCKMPCTIRTGRQPGHGDAVGTMTVNDATLSMFMAKPAGTPHNDYWIHATVDVPKQEQSGQFRVGMCAFGNLTIRASVREGDKEVHQATWHFQGETEFFYAVLQPYRSWGQEKIAIEAGQTLHLDIDFLPTLLEDDQGPEATHGGFQIGMELCEDEGQLIDEAASLAQRADVTLVLTTLGKHWESESFDRPHLHLPRRQDDLIQAVSKAAGRKVVVLNVTGSPLDMPWRHDVAGLVQMWYGGQEGAASLCDVLLARGEAPASGRLAHTWPQRIEDHPSGGDPLHFPGTKQDGDDVGPHVKYVEGRLVGHRYFNKHANAPPPAFHFGEGLGGYTTFVTTGPTLISGASQEVSAVHVTQASLPLQLKVKTRNTGPRSGKEVAQLYLRPHAPLTAMDDEPVQWLVGFATLRAAVDQQAEATITLYQEAFSRWHEQTNAWQVKAGGYDIVLARSARLEDELGRLTVVIDAPWSWTGLGM